jgi:hypothetical protein
MLKMTSSYRRQNAMLFGYFYLLQEHAHFLITQFYCFVKTTTTRITIFNSEVTSLYENICTFLRIRFFKISLPSNISYHYGTFKDMDLYTLTPMWNISGFLSGYFCIFTVLTLHPKSFVPHAAKINNCLFNFNFRLGFRDCNAYKNEPR